MGAPELGEVVEARREAGGVEKGSPFLEGDVESAHGEVHLTAHRIGSKVDDVRHEPQRRVLRVLEDVAPVR